MERVEQREAELLRRLDRNSLPGHVVMIMDGNGRWAREKGLPRTAGHRRGVDTVREIVRYSHHLGLRCLTLFAFSTENWNRPVEEINFLMSLPEQYLQQELPELIRNNIRLHFAGDREGLPASVRDAVEEGSIATRFNDGMILNIALNYGSRQEILQAIRCLVEEVRQGKGPRIINEEIFSGYLYTAGLPDPDLLIRTGGEHRLSNFLLWQLAYSELVFTPVYWPDFNRLHLLDALWEYQSRERRFGRI